MWLQAVELCLGHDPGASVWHAVEASSYGPILAGRRDTDEEVNEDEDDEEEGRAGAIQKRQRPQQDLVLQSSKKKKKKIKA